MKKVYLGIDVGKNGGLVKVNSAFEIIDSLVMPTIGSEYDIKSIREFITNPEHSIQHTAIENVHAMQGKIGGSSNFSFGLGKGILMGLMEGLQIPYTLVNPKAWQTVAWEGVTKQTDNKKTSLIAANRLFPNHSFVPTPRSRVAHDGLVDSALIAYYIASKLN